ncbi:hypothetical protein V491_02563 [Pseudogymnoascus sp. VKM F-3775]|nr:hypothetical protein V491_02563 [Pseudogymnoascus sp. VKM F-3775]
MRGSSLCAGRPHSSDSNVDEDSAVSLSRTSTAVSEAKMMGMAKAERQAEWSARWSFQPAGEIGPTNSIPQWMSLRSLPC